MVEINILHTIVITSVFLFLLFFIWQPRVDFDDLRGRKYTEEVLETRTTIEHFALNTLLLVIRRTYENGKIKIIHRKIRY